MSLKRNFLLLTLLFAGLSNTFAQVVTFEPSFATQLDSMTVILDATQGNGELEDFIGDVYLHTGVITNKSTSGSDWKYVPYGWETNDASMKATFIGDNKWEFKYKPSIREFFGITDASEDVEKVAIVYKGVSGGSIVAEGKDEGNADIFIELTSGDASARFINPTEDWLMLDAETTTEIEISGIGTVNGGTLELSLLLNGTELSSTADDTLNYTYSIGAEDEDLNFELIAANGIVADTTSFFATIRKGNGASVDRPAGIKDGINYTGQSTVTFSLFAPGKEFVYLLGDFNNWRPSSEYLMNRSGRVDSLRFWLEIDGLTPGEEYAFQYLVDGEIRIADPYSELILDQYNDPYIPESVFPDLKSYPTDKTEHIVGVIFPGKEAYEWQAADYVRPAKDELVIYELLMRDFLATPSYATLIDTLDYLDRLGINAIELMPVNEFDGNLSWGYNPAFHMALDKYYGSPEEFKRFVDEAHKRGIAVILDVVLNHTFGQNPIARLWNEGDYGNPTSDNPYLNVSPTHPFNVGYDLNHESPITRYYSKRVMQYWLEEYNVDGYRFDLSKGFTQTNNPDNVGAWGSYDQSRVDIWIDYANHIRSVEEDAYIILEHFADNSEEKVLADNGIMLWGNMNHEYNEATMGYSSNLTGVLAQSRGFNERNLVGYMESHDEQWLMYKNRMYGNSSGSYDITELPTALDRMELAGAFFFTLPGPKMMWQFGELGYGYGDSGEQCLDDGSGNTCSSSQAPGRTDAKPIRWDYQNDSDRVDLYNTWSDIINLRMKTNAFTYPDDSYYALSGGVKYIRLFSEDTDVVVIGNFGVTSTTQTVDFTQDGTWYDYFGESTISVSNGQSTMDLGPGEFRIFTTKNFRTSVSVEENGEGDQPAQFMLYQNYPNPFNPTTNLTFEIAEAGDVTLEVYNMLGQKVAELVNGRKAAGVHTVQFDASDLSSGIYITRLSSAGNVQTIKMTLLK